MKGGRSISKEILLLAHIQVLAHIQSTPEKAWFALQAIKQK